MKLLQIKITLTLFIVHCSLFMRKVQQLPHGFKIQPSKEVIIPLVILQQPPIKL